MKFYCVFSGPLAGSMRDSYIENLGDNVFNTLHSYWYFKGLPDDRIENEFKVTKGNIMIDSGAFTAWSKNIDLDVDEYLEWINKWDKYVTTFGQIDVIPPKDATVKDIYDCCQKTWDNYIYMTQRMTSPKKLLYTFHYGEDFKWLKDILDYRFPDGSPVEYMAFGGLVGRTTKQRTAFLDECFRIIANSSNPNIKVHGFGVSSATMWKKYPFESCDSFTPGMNTNHGFTYGEDGKTYRTQDYKKLYKPNEKDMADNKKKGLLQVKENPIIDLGDEGRIYEKTKLLVHNIKYWDDLANSTTKPDINKFKTKAGLLSKHNK